MKKLLLWLLVMVLAWGGTVALGEEPLHELWGMRFGSAREEVISVAKEKGITLVDNGPSELKISKEQTVTFLGNEINSMQVRLTNRPGTRMVDAYGIPYKYDGDGIADTLKSIDIFVGEVKGGTFRNGKMIFTESDMEILTQSGELFYSLLEAFADQYGEPDALYVSQTTYGIKNTHQAKKATLVADFIDAMLQNEGYRFKAQFRNVELSCSYIEGFGNITLWSIITYRDAPMYAYEINEIHALPLWGEDEAIEKEVDLGF